MTNTDNHFTGQFRENRGDDVLPIWQNIPRLAGWAGLGRNNFERFGRHNMPSLTFWTSTISRK